MAVPFSRYGASSSSGGDGRCNDGKSRGCHRPAWEAAARHAGLGLAGALNARDAVPHAATVVTAGQSFRSPASLAADRSTRSSSLSLMMSPREMMEASEDYTRVIVRGGTPNPRTTHIFDDRGGGFSVGAGGEDDDGESFLRWCHSCSKELGHGKDIFMYRGEMAFCSHECRYREMLLFDEEP